MAAVTYSDGTAINDSLTNERMIRTWISPSTMDSADTVIVPTVTGKTVRIIGCFDNTTGDSVTATVSSFTVTLDAAGGTTDHTYVLRYVYV